MALGCALSLNALMRSNHRNQHFHIILLNTIVVAVSILLDKTLKKRKNNKFAEHNS
jgi:uncharacterized membrane protein YGL010W